MKQLVHKIHGFVVRHITECIWSALFFLIQMASLVVFYFFKHQNDYFISRESKLLFLAVLLSGIVIPWLRLVLNKYVKLVLGTALFLLSPYFVFQLNEQIVNTFETFLPEARIWNVLFIIAIQCIIVGITRNLFLSCLITYMGIFAFYVADYFVIQFRKTPVLFTDILSYKTAIGVSGNYVYVLSDSIFKSFIFCLLFIWLGFLFTTRKVLPKIVRSFSFPALAVLGITILFLFTRTDFLIDKKFTNMPFVPTLSSFKNGLLVDDCVNSRKSMFQKPEHYSTGTVEEIIRKYTDSAVLTDSGVRPNIIVVMSESYTDIDYWETAKLTEEPSPFFKSLKENTINGTLISGILGGNTPNSEFEFLTGGSLAFLPSGMVVFQQSIASELPTLASNLKNLGYNATALHLYNPEYWYRNRIYPLLGFDEFISIENCDTSQLEILRDYASDKSHFNYIIDLYENKAPDSPFFCYCVTVQNHGGYWTGMRDILVTNGNSDYANEYASLLKITDAEYQKLIQYFEQVEEPTIICTFGDHQPFLFDDFYASIWEGCEFDEIQQRYLQAKVPFKIWANYDIPEREIGETSINYLSAMLLDVAGLPMSAFEQYLLKLQEKVPVISAIGSVDNEGNYVQDYHDSKYAEDLQEYEFLQYYYLNHQNNLDFWIYNK